jgi:pimeloyl-ACP methyl ester carboxylesterase
MKVSYQELKVNDYTIRGLLTTPDLYSSAMVVFLHGYTGHKNENGYFFKYLSFALAEKGISSLRFDYYGNGDSDGYFSDFTFDTTHNDALAILDLAYRLNNQKKVILFGFSMGGALASRVSLERMNEIEKLVLASPAANMAQIVLGSYMVRKEEKGKGVDMGGYYLSKKTVDSFQKVDYYEGCETFTKPVLIIHATKDAAVPLSFSKKYSEMYPNCQYHIIDDSTHCYTSVAWREMVKQYLIDFIEK